jgi:hypothetical protein
MKLFRKDVISITPVRLVVAAIVTAACAFVILVWLCAPNVFDFFSYNEKGADLVVEVFGFLLDIVFIVILFKLYDMWRERKTKIRDYHDQLRDFIHWKGEEGVLRKVGIIKRLNEMRAPLPDMIGIVLTGVKLSRADLGSADLRLANLVGADLSSTKLQGTNFLNANLKGADLMEANLKGADLRRANLEEADLNGANLEGAVLRHANLKGARLWEANLEGADLSYAVLDNADLYSAIGLTREQLEHAKGVDSASLPGYLWHEDEEKGENKNKD